jgi:hypothetical protein
MLADVQSGASWAKNMDWCLRYIDEENNPYTATNQAVIVQGTLVTSAVTPEVLAHPDMIVIFPLCWHACLFGSQLKFDVSYDRAHPQQLLSIEMSKRRGATDL